MGRRKNKGKGKGKGAKGKGGKGTSNLDYWIRLDTSISDSEIVEFECELPSLKMLDDLNIPIPNIDIPIIEELEKILDFSDHCDNGIDHAELITVWRERSSDYFFLLSVEEKHQARRDIIHEIKTRKRIKWFKKRKFALQKNKEEEDNEEEHDDGLDDDGVEGSRSVDDVREIEGEIMRANEDKVMDSKENDSGKAIDSFSFGSMTEVLDELIASAHNAIENVTNIGDYGEEEEDPSLFAPADKGFPEEKEEDLSLLTPNDISFPIYLDNDHVSYNDKPLTVCLFVEHGYSDMSHSIYLIQPDLSPVQSYEIDSNGFFVDNNISPFLTFNMDKLNPLLLVYPAMFKMGSLIYFIGGGNHDAYMSIPFGAYTDVSNDFKLCVRVLDTNRPESGLHSVASMNYPKQTPCVFEADGIMYALGSAWSVAGHEIMRNKDPSPRTGCFERYDPKLNAWKVLPDPPIPSIERRHTKWSGLVTVVDRHVIIGNLFHSGAVFNLDTLEWVPFQPANRFYYGSIYYDSHIYYLRGYEGPETHPRDPEIHCPLEIVKRRIFVKGDHSGLTSLKCGKAKVLATAKQLDGHDTLLNRDGFEYWRKIFHLGDHVFCYVVTCQLVESYEDATVYEPQCRGVWIKFFKEVQADQNDKNEFRLLGSFSYKSSTPFINSNMSVGCCVFGSVPEEWMKGVPLTQILEKQKNFSPEQCHSEPEYENTEFEDEVLHLEEELKRLRSEIAVKTKLLETMLAERPRKIQQAIKTQETCCD